MLFFKVLYIYVKYVYDELLVLDFVCVIEMLRC